MNANHDLQRRLLDLYSSEPPVRAPDWVLRVALATIDTTPQRRSLIAPWRFAHMTTGMKLAVAVLVVAVGAFAAWQFMPAPPSPGSSPAAPTPSAVSTTAPTAAQGVYVPPALTETFTSDVHGISISYPAGWTARAATEPWTTEAEPVFIEPAADVLYDPRLEDHMHMSLASQPLGDSSFEAWSTAMGGGACTGSEPVVVDGADGVRCGLLALVSVGGRGYLIHLRKSDDEEELRKFDATDWFAEVLATVQLQPDRAVDG